MCLGLIMLAAKIKYTFSVNIATVRDYMAPKPKISLKSDSQIATKSKCSVDSVYFFHE